MARVTQPPAPTIGPELRRRHLTVASVQGYKHLGCYSDSPDRILAGIVDEQVVRNDPTYCCEWCRFIGTDYQYCGLENGNQCYCDSTTAYDIATEPAFRCNSQCPGAGDVACGDFFYMNLYTMTSSTTGAPQRGTPTHADVRGYSYLGCFTDHDERVLADAQITPEVLNPEFCCDWCAHQGGGYQLCGVEFGDQCYCGSDTANGALRATATDCSQACDGHGDVQCGGLYRVNVYSATGVTTTSVTEGISSTHSATSVIESIGSTHSETDTTAASSTSTNSPDSEGGSGSSSLSGGAIAGIAIGAVAVLALVAAVFLLRRRLAAQFGKGKDGPSQLDDSQVGPSDIGKHPRYANEPAGSTLYGRYAMVQPSEMNGSAHREAAELVS